MTTEKARKIQAMLDFVKEAEAMAETADEMAEEDMDEVARLAQEDPLPIERARPLYAKILKILHPERNDEEIASQVEEILSRGPERPES